jgi:ubiquitin-activating enzyme E1
VFDAADPVHLDFIITASNLRAQNFGLKGETNPSYFRKVLENVTVPPFVGKTEGKIATTEAEAKELADKVDDDHGAKVKATIAALPSPPSLAGFRLNPVEFEKDCEGNHHVEFVTACSNLRARNYAIKEVSAHETKFIAGKIIPAIATTTALVTGIVCLELYKLVEGKSTIEQYRNFSCNLALPFFSYAEPIAPVTSTTELKSGPWKWSLWDRITINIGDATLEQFMTYFQETYNLEVSMLSHGAAMIYYNFGVNVKKKMADRMGKKLSELVTTIGNAKITPKEKYLVIELVVSNENGDDVDIPPVRFQFRP